MTTDRTTRIFIAVIVSSALIIFVVVPGAILLALGKQRLAGTWEEIPALAFEEALFSAVILAVINAILNSIAGRDDSRAATLVNGAFRGAVLGR